MPREYMGVSTLAPPSPSEESLLSEAALRGLAVNGDCPYFGAMRLPPSLPCDLIPLSSLAALAWSGNRHAMLELGKRFEYGRGVSVDIDKARDLYRGASITTGGTTFVYAPPVGEGYGTVIPINTPLVRGLPEAERRLAALPLPTKRSRKSD